MGISSASKKHIGSWGGDHRMGLLWRLFAPKPLKKARRTVSNDWSIGPPDPAAGRAARG